MNTYALKSAVIAALILLGTGVRPHRQRGQSGEIDGYIDGHVGTGERDAARLQAGLPLGLIMPSAGVLSGTPTAPF